MRWLAPTWCSASAPSPASTRWAGTRPRCWRRWRARASHRDDIDALVDAVVQAARPGDHVLVMSNGGFGGIHGKLLDALERRA